MNWTELRPKLREQYGNRFGFYNDKYRSGIRRIKIRCNGIDGDEMKQFILEQDPTLNVEEWDWTPYISEGAINCKVNCIVIRYNE